MNTEKAKVPDDTAIDWQAIDIFLFSNGQQYTPPRKYHLCNEELDWWKTTLNFLAREHYGSMHSIIDLYTIDGHKVEGPLELSNGNAYVAVTPPDSFIDSGYDKYLIKASRSWEKRQARKSNLEITVPEHNIEAKRSKSDLDFKNQNVLANTTTLETVSANKHEDQTNMNLRPLVHSPQTARRSTPTMVEKKRHSIQRTSILRKNSNPITSPPTNRKTSLKPNDITLRRNSKGPVKTNDKLPPDNRSKGTANSKRTSKTPNNVKEATPTLVQTKVNEGSSKITISPGKVRTLKNKSSLTDNAQIENVIDDKDIIVVTNIYRHSRGEISSVVADDAENPLLFRNLHNKVPSDIDEGTLRPESVHTLGQNAMTNNSILGSINLSNDATTLPEINSQITIIDAPEAHLPKNNIGSEQAAGNNYLTFINKGDVVNLKLQIEIRNRDGVVCTNPENNIHISYSYTNIKKQKDSHINIEDNIIVQSTSLQSLLGKEFVNGVGTGGNSKIVIVKCACCDQYDENLPQYVDKDKTYVNLPPTVRHEDSITSCHCEQEITSNKEELIKERDMQQINMQTVIYTIKKTCSATSLETLTKIKHKQETLSTQSRTETLSSKIDSNLLHSEKNPRNEFENILAIRNVTLTENEESKTKHIIDGHEYDPKTKESELFVLKNDETIALPKNVMDKFTQTEWCSILLEARRHEDGHYSFHLPPLKVLRSYDL